MQSQDHPTAMALLLSLPGPCLLAVLQGCADDPASLFNAARAHSRLHQAAVLALNSIAVDSRTQEQVDSLLLYLDNHGRHVRSLSLGARGLTKSVTPGAPVYLRRLPANMQLHSLQLSKLHIPALVWEDLQQVTHLELADVFLQDPAVRSASLPSLQHLTGLADLCISPLDSPIAPMEGGWLSGCHCLTRLVLSSYAYGGHIMLHPGMLAGHTQLQHLEARGCSISGGSAGCAQLLSGLQNLQQLTHLSWADGFKGSIPPAAAFSALTASSRLQHLGLNHCTLQEDVWQHLFSAGRALPHLTSLDVVAVKEPNLRCAKAPAGALLSSCCPGLQSLDICYLRCSAEHLAPLKGLSRLHRLVIRPPFPASLPLLLQRFEAVAELTALRHLTLVMSCRAEGSPELLLKLTRLRHLTKLNYYGPGGLIHMEQQAAADEPVWRQLLQHHLDNKDPELAQQAAAALAES